VRKVELEAVAVERQRRLDLLYRHADVVDALEHAPQSIPAPLPAAYPSERRCSLYAQR